MILKTVQVCQENDACFVIVSRGLKDVSREFNGWLEQRVLGFDVSLVERTERLGSHGCNCVKNP